MVYFLLADGFEETEAIVPIDILKRAGFDVKTVSFKDGPFVTGNHNITVKCDINLKDGDFSDITAVVMPGGMPGADNLDKEPKTDEILKSAKEKNAVMAAICAAPMILGKRGYLEGKKATCYQGFEGFLKGAQVLRKAAVRDEKIVTASGAGGAFEFAFELLCALGSDPGKIKKQINFFR